MGRDLTAEDLDAAAIGGVFLSAGGSGKRSAQNGRALGALALERGRVRLVELDELAPDAAIITATAVGAPGVAAPMIKPQDAIDAATRLIANLVVAPAGVICGHVPGFNAWLVAAALGLDYVDAASNGRGHPTVKMGGMGLASRLDLSIAQVACSGSAAEKTRFEIIVDGDIVRTSNVMRQAAIGNGGLIYAARGALSAAFVKANGAPGAIAFQLALGRAMLAAGGSARVQATLDHLDGTLLVDGEVIENSVRYSNGFDLGRMVVRGDGREAVLGVYNEFMTAELDGARVATFPDMIGTLDPMTGDPVSISERPVGSHVAVIVAHRSKFPVGSGARDPAVFPEVEAAMGADLASYL